MYNCYQCDDLISDYIEGKLDSNSRQLFDNHSKVCPPCAKKSGNVKTLHKILTTLPGKQVSPDFDTMLRARIRIENKKEKQKRESLLFSWKIRVPIYGISVALVVLILLTVFSQLSDKDTFSPVVQEYAVNNQNVLAGGYTVYSLEHKSAIEVLSQQSSRNINEGIETNDASSDSSSLSGYDEPMRSTSVDFYQTSF